ncbi:ACT domain-containing protein [Aliikangiella marina]|uniref:ACT domain-containing protein n=1 Tax=Aliikangiella marina TaxID=1712262 RepID=A0A545TCR4_9GAMM|nr:ACT domain-containing protein [Aliikangiella marina]TQV75012.1 ACT domain-containing protein [Aliikangiella marina]
MQNLTIVAKDYTGLLADITELLSQAQLNIQNIGAQKVETTALIKLQSCDAEKAYQLLTDAGYHVVSRAGILVRVLDESGALAKISRTLAEASIDIRGINIVEHHDGFVIVSISCSDSDKARDVLGKMVL